MEENAIVTTAIEMSWPNTRMLPAVADALPAYLSGTELMMEFIFGDENTAKPQPSMIRIEIIIQIGVMFVSKDRKNKEAAIIAIPMVARIRGSM